MPLPGGAASKLSTAYELQWTAICMVHVLRGEASSIRLEPVGPEGQGVEFWLEKNDGREYHQVKRQQAGTGKWSIRSLSAVLLNFSTHLKRDTKCRCVFVSMEAANELKEMSDRSRSSQSSEEFFSCFSTSKHLKNCFSELEELWDVASKEAVLPMLRRVHVRTVDNISMQEMIFDKLAPLIKGNPDHAINAMMRCGLDNVHKELNNPEILKMLRSAGIEFYADYVAPFEDEKLQVECHFCRTVFDYGIKVCPGPNCGAEVIYGPTVEEYRNGFYMGGFAGVVPIILGANFFGINFSMYLLVACAVGGLIGTTFSVLINNKLAGDRVLFMRHTHNV